MRFIMANDHAAAELKDQLRGWLEGHGHEVHDLGVQAGDRADYPDKSREAAELYMRGGYDYGIVCCGTGIGISISANKVPGIRCALPQNRFAAAMAKEHNNCQFLAFGGRIHYTDSPAAMLEAFLNTDFNESGRHRRRVEKIMDIEKRQEQRTVPKNRFCRKGEDQ